MLLIGGPPGAGKTTLGRAVAAELGFGSLTIDDSAITPGGIRRPGFVHQFLSNLAGLTVVVVL